MERVDCSFLSHTYSSSSYSGDFPSEQCQARLSSSYSCLVFWPSFFFIASQEHVTFVNFDPFSCFLLPPRGVKRVPIHTHTASLPAHLPAWAPARAKATRLLRYH